MPFDPTTLTGAALKDFQRIGGIPVDKFAKYQAAGLLGNWGKASDGGMNATNLDYVRGGQQTDPTYATIQNLLNPNWGVQAYDSAQASAEDAAARGISGSNLANFRGARQYASDIRGNALAANQLLSGATSRLPTPYDPLPSARLAQESSHQSAQLAQQLLLAREGQAAETNRALIAANSRYGGGGGGGGGRGQPSGGPAGGWTPSPFSGGAYPGAGSNGGTSSFPSTYVGDYTSSFPATYAGDWSPAGDQFGNQAWDTNTGTGSYDFGTGTFDTGGGSSDYGPAISDLFGASGGTGTIDSGGGDWWNQPVTPNESFGDYGQ